MSVQSTKPQGMRVSQKYHDWLLGEDSALRAFLPATFPACSPQADAAAPRSLPGAGAAAPIPEETP